MIGGKENMKNLSIKKYLILVTVVIMCCIVVIVCKKSIKDESIKDDYPDTVMILTTNDLVLIMEKYGLEYDDYRSVMVDGQGFTIRVRRTATPEVELSTAWNLTVERVENYKKLLIELFGSEYTTEYPYDFEYVLKWDNGVTLYKGKNESSGLCRIKIIKE